jgi:outer membrane protein assembly factor BamD
VGKRWQAMAAAVWLAAVLGCASGPEARPRVSYRVSAKENFIKGRKAMADEDYLEAIEYFKFVKNKFPYSAYATQSDLLLADCQYERDRFLEAADAYLNFIKLHPKNEKVPYAMFRIGASFYERIPSDFFIFPPAFEMDQKETKRAVRELERYLARFPDDENAPAARDMLAECKRRLAQRVHFVMEFNRERDKHRGALWRAEQLLADYAGSGFDEQALWIKASSLDALGRADEARAAAAELIQRYPQGEYSEDARRLLERLPAAEAGRETGT